MIGLSIRCRRSFCESAGENAPYINAYIGLKNRLVFHSFSFILHPL